TSSGRPSTSVTPAGSRRTRDRHGAGGRGHSRTWQPWLARFPRQACAWPVLRAPVGACLWERRQAAAPKTSDQTLTFADLASQETRRGPGYLRASRVSLVRLALSPSASAIAALLTGLLGEIVDPRQPEAHHHVMAIREGSDHGGSDPIRYVPRPSEGLAMPSD